MALTADTPRAYELGNINELPVKGSTKIYEGAAVGDAAAGYVRGLVAGDPFRGFAQRQADNSSGSDGDIKVKVITEGLIRLTITGIAITDVGKPVYASADGTFTLTAGSNSLIGYVHRYVTTNTCIVAFSDSVIASANLSTLDSKVVSLSTIISANLSTGDSKDASQSALISNHESRMASHSV